MNAADLSRHDIETLIEALIAMLDEMDSGDDLEDADTGIADADGLSEQWPQRALWVA